MKTLQIHYIKEFFKLLTIISLGLSTIFSLIELIDKIDDFMPLNPSLYNLILYAILHIPKYLYYVLPMSILISSLFIFSYSARNKEFIAIKSAGGRLKKIFYPFILIGFLMTLLSLFIGEFVVPESSKMSRNLKESIKKSERKVSYKSGTIWFRGTDGSIAKIELYIPDKNLAKNISIFSFGNNSLTKRIEAEYGTWQSEKGNKGFWDLKNVFVYDIQKNNIFFTKEMKYYNLESPQLFSETIRSSEEMGIIELWKYIKKLKSFGFKNQKLIVDLNSKISYPFANLFLIILGISFSALRRVGGSMIAAGIGITISIVYWISYSFMLSMGYAGLLYPPIATWIIPASFGLFAIYLFAKIQE